MNQVFHSKDPQGQLTLSNNAKRKIQHIKEQQQIIGSGEVDRRNLGNVNLQSFPTQATAIKMKLELQDNTPPAPIRSKNSSSVDEIMTKQLNDRLASVLHHISSKHYDRAEHKKRLELIQNNLDKKFDTKRKDVRLKVNHHMTGPAFRKIIAQK